MEILTEFNIVVNDQCHNNYNNTYRIGGNFRLEKIFAFFAQARRGRKFFRRTILPGQ